MIKFQYTAISTQGKSLNGVIEAENKENARNKLYQLKLSVVSLEEISDTDLEKSNFLKYKFEALDKENKKVIGTISSSSILSAYQKLNQEYKLDVKKLASTNATKQEFEESTNKIQKLNQQLNLLTQNKNNDNSKSEYDKEQKNAEFQKIIEEIIATIKKINTKFSSQLKPDAIEFLNKYEEHLNKIKFSENTENIIQAALKVLNHIQTSEIFLANSENFEEQLDLQIDILRLNKILNNQSNQHNELLQTLNNTFSKIGLKLNLNLKHKFNKLLGYIEIIFKTKSSKIRQEAIIKFFKEIVNKFNQKKDFKSKFFEENNFKISQTQQDFLSLTNWLLILFLFYYFISIFISQKIAKFEVNKIFFVYNTKFLIYIIISLILIHGSIKINIELKKRKFEKHNYIFYIFGLLFIMILINL